jgi:ArsR family transcriptional regulator
VDLVTELGLAQSTVSKHITCLLTASWSTSGSRAASPSTHWLSRPCRTSWPAAEQLLEATGSAVALCPNYGVCE